MNIIDLFKVIYKNLLTKEGRIQLIIYIVLAGLNIYFFNLEVVIRLLIWGLSLAASSGLVIDTIEFIKSIKLKSSLKLFLSIFFFLIVLFFDMKYLNMKSMTSSFLLGFIISIIVIIKVNRSKIK